MRLDAGGHETWAPVGIAVSLTVPAVLALTGNSWAGTLTWIVQPLGSEGEWGPARSCTDKWPAVSPC